MDQSLVSVMKSIGKALRLDSDNNYQDAYINYAECMLSIVSNLLHNIKTDGGKVVASKEVIRHIQLGQQCMERLAALVQTLVSNQNASTGRMAPQSNTMSSLGLGPSLQLAKRKQGPSPMELAYIRNQQIMSAYKTRLALMNKGSQATQLRLTIQRKMAENLAIAKAQEQALAKKMNERQNRLEEQAQRRFSAPMGMSEDEQEQRQIYKKILEYEQDAKWLAKWREKLESSPEDPIVINQLIQEILRCSDHPLTQLLKKYQHRIYERLYPIVCNKMKQLKDITVPLPSYLHPPGDTGRTKEEPVDNIATGSESKRLDADQSDNSDGDNTDSDNAGPSHDDGKEDDLSDKKVNEENGDEISEKEIDANKDENDDNNSEKEGKEDNVSNLPKLNSESSLISTENGDESEVERVIKEVVESGPYDVGDDNVDDESSLKDMDDLVEASQENLESAIVRGAKLEKQLTIENESADSVIKGISEYEKYNDENMDDLFDDDDDDDLAEDDKPESDRGNSADAGVLNSDTKLKNTQMTTSNSDDHLPSMDNNTTDITSRDKVNSSGDNSLPPIGNLPKSVSMDSNSTSLPSFFSSETGSLKSSQSVDSLSEDQLLKLSEEACRRHLTGISQDVHSYLEKLLLMFTIAYENLDSATGRDQCYASLEEPFFKPIWKYILALFRLGNRTSEKMLAYKMTTEESCVPKDFNVAKKLWLVKDDKNWLPYSAAIVELKKVKEYYTMLSKLECVVRVCKEACACVEDYYTSGESKSGRKTPPSVGADDLLPILSYIVVKSQLPQLVSECQAMAEFIHEGYIMGEEGYCLTSLQTAVNFLTSQGETTI